MLDCALEKATFLCPNCRTRVPHVASVAPDSPSGTATSTTFGRTTRSRFPVMIAGHRTHRGRNAAGARSSTSSIQAHAINASPMSDWATPIRIDLELDTVRLRDFSTRRSATASMPAWSPRSLPVTVHRNQKFSHVWHRRRNTRSGPCTVASAASPGNRVFVIHRVGFS